MSYIHSSLYEKVKRAMNIADTSTQPELLELVKRNVRTDIEVSVVTDHAIVVESGIVYIEFEYEYFTMDDRCLINVVLVRID